LPLGPPSGKACSCMFTVLFSLFLPGSQDCLPPAASSRRRRLARRPGYMRSAAGPWIGFLFQGAATPLRAQGGACGEESHQSESRAGRCGLDPGGQRQGPLVGSPVPRSTAASALTSVGYLGLALTPVRGPSGLFGIQLRAGTTLPARPARSCGPGDSGWQGKLPSMDSSEPPGPGWDAAGGERAKGTWTKGCLSPEEVNGNSCSLGSGPRVPSAPAGSQDAFTSSFSFIRLSLGSAGERGEAEGCPPSREAKAPCQSPEEMEAKAASLDRPHEHPRLLSPHFNLKPTQRLAHSAQTAGGGHRLESETLSLLDVATASFCSPGPSWSEGSSLGDAQRWETLLRRCEPVLLDCLLSDQRRLEVKSLQLKLQKLQEKAVEDDDYDKAEALRHRLDELEKEKSSLQFQLPSRQPALCSLLGHLHAQAQAAVRHRATQPLQERIKSLNLSLKDITAKVCMSEKLSSTLRKKVNDIETQLPALLEAKMLAISGNHFSTAKELTEEIRSLTSEKEGLEGLLDKLRVLSSRNLDQGETAYGKYYTCPLLRKVWGADLEACRLLIQSLQLQETGGTLSAEDERQTDDLEGAVYAATPAVSPRLHSEVERKTSLQAFEDWKAHLSPSLYFAGSEQKEESCVLSAELGEKCEAIDKKLLYLEDQLHTAIHSHDEDLIHILFILELQMVKETLQAMILQLQPAKEAGEREAAASCVTAGVQEAQA
uniref:DISC1 scaffold protein n=1 Tax=Ursus maritimus TaxID=29073 RepID=A0A452TJR8_URSMA